MALCITVITGYIGYHIIHKSPIVPDSNDYAKKQDSLNQVILRELDSLKPLDKNISVLNTKVDSTNKIIQSDEYKTIYIEEQYDSLVPVINSYDVEQLRRYLTNY